MTLPASGPISMQDVNIELRANPTSPLDLNHPAVRKVAGKAFETLNTQISMADLLGRSYFTYEVYNQPMFVQRFRTNDEWRYCMGFKIVATAPVDAVLNRVTAYNEQDGVIFDRYLSVSGKGDWMITTNPQVGVGATEGYDQACVTNPTNTIYVGVRLSDINSDHRYNIHRMVVWDTNGGSYELYGHRNLVVSGTFKERGVGDFGGFWSRVNGRVTLVPPNN